MLVLAYSAHAFDCVSARFHTRGRCFGKPKCHPVAGYRRKASWRHQPVNKEQPSWHCPIFLCVNCSKLAFTLVTRSTAGTPRWNATFSAFATTSTFSI